MDIRELTVDEVRKYIEENYNQLPETLIKQLKVDPRRGVRKIYQQLIRKREQLREERKRVWELYNFERETGCTLVAGVDEAGRGPLAGPVVA
ncbi:Ribonuclease H, partial [Calderihabitans maritimus]